MARMRSFAPVLLVLWLVAAAPCLALDEMHWKKADEAIKRAIAYLREHQGADGSWSPKPGPAITAMVLRGMLDQPDIRSNDPAAKKAIDYVLSKAKPDGGIYDDIVPNYNTAICLSALARVNDRSGVPEAIKKAQDYLRNLQWDGQKDAQGNTVDKEHPFYGGAGYSKNSRPDLSNTQVMLEGLYDSGLDCNDPAFKRALVFISRCQGTKSNTLLGDKIVPDGGFIYSPSTDKDHINQPSSPAGSETVDVPGAGAQSRLRTYGSMTYGGFKSYLYANLSHDDPRVVDAFNWIRHNYTVDANPGMPQGQNLQGYYYYLLTFSRALGTWGSTTIPVDHGQPRDWANDLIDKLASTQEKDGSWHNATDRWMESDANLATAYALLALQRAIH